MSDQVHQSTNENSATTNPSEPLDESAPLDVLPVAEEPKDDASIPLVLPVDPGDAESASGSAEDLLPPRAPRPPHPGFWFAVLWCIAFMALQLVAGIAVGVVFGMAAAIASAGEMSKSTPFDASKLEEEARVPSLVVGSALGVLSAVLVIRLVVGKLWRRRLALVRPSFTHVILAVFALPAVMYLSQATYELALFLHFPTFEYQRFLIKLFGNLPWWFGVLVVGVAPAITEELMFRGFIGRGLVARYGPASGVLLTSLLFGSIHLDPPHIAATFAMGVCLHYAYLMTRSLWVPMLMHFLNNSWGVTAMMWQPDSLNHVDDATPSYLFAAAAFLGLAAAWAFYRGRACLVTSPTPDAPSWLPAFPGVEAPPAGSSTYVARPWPGWAPTGAVLLAIAGFVTAFVVAIG